MRDALSRLTALAHKEALHILRDRQMTYLAVGMPVVLLVLFGYAVNFDVDEIAVAVVDEDDSPSSRAWMSRVDARRVSGRSWLADAREVSSLSTGVVVAAFVILARSARAGRDQHVDVQMILDGADGTTARTAMGYAAAFGQHVVMGA